MPLKCTKTIEKGSSNTDLEGCFLFLASKIVFRSLLYIVFTQKVINNTGRKLKNFIFLDFSDIFPCLTLQRMGKCPGR